MKKILIKFGIVYSTVFPIIASASVNNLRELIDLIILYFNYGIFLIMGLATVMFVFNVFKYFIYSGDDAGAKKEAGLYVMYSLIGFFVILSFWGLVNILMNTFSLNSNQPALPFGSFRSSNTSVQTGVFGNTNTQPSTSNTSNTNTNGTFSQPPVGTVTPPNTPTGTVTPPNRSAE